MKHDRPDRNWDDAIAKCRDEGKCRLCGVERGIQAAHTIGSEHDRPRRPGAKKLYVEPDAVLPLCAHCQGEQERGEVGILEVTTFDEQLYAVRILGSIEEARRKLDPLDYRRDIEAARIEARLAA